MDAPAKGTAMRGGVSTSGGPALLDGPGDLPMGEWPTARRALPLGASRGVRTGVEDRNITGCNRSLLAVRTGVEDRKRSTDITRRKACGPALSLPADLAIGGVLAPRGSRSTTTSTGARTGRMA